MFSPVHQKTKNLSNLNKRSSKHLKNISEGTKKNLMSNNKYGKITNYIFNKDTNLLMGVSFEHTKIIEFLYTKAILNSFYQVIFAIISILSGFIQYELTYSDNKSQADNKIIFTEWICFITSVGLWITFIFEYLIDCKINFYINKLPESLWRRDKKMIFSLIRNILIFIWHPNPLFHNITFFIYNTKFMFNQELYLNSIMFSLLLIRLWFIFKLLVVFSDYSSARTQRICRMNNFSVSFSFCMKALMQNIPYHVYGTLLLLCIIFCSCNLRIYERGLDDVSGLEFSNYWNAIWCIIITMTTVGFGDYYPSSIIGRIIGIISCFNGVFLISMLVVTITNVLNLSEPEQNVYTIIEKVTLEGKKLKIAKELILKYIKIIKKYKENGETEEVNNLKYDFLRKYSQFKEIVTEIESTYPPYTQYDSINDNLNIIEDEIFQLESKQKEILMYIESMKA